MYTDIYESDYVLSDNSVFKCPYYVVSLLSYIP